MKVTLKDIAERLGMNYSTVSYALNGKGSIKEETRDYIRRVAAEMGYVPDHSARQIHSGKNDLIGIIVPNVLFEYGEFCEHAYRLLNNAGYQVMIAVSEFSAGKEEEIIRTMLSRNVAGLIMTPTRREFHTDAADDPFKLLAARRTPVVIRNMNTPLPCDCVRADYRECGRMLGSILRKKRKRRGVFAVPHPAPFADNVTETHAGLEEAMGGAVELFALDYEECPDSGFAPGNPHYGGQLRHLLGAGGIKTGRRLFRELRKQGLPEAVVCSHEHAALGMELEAAECGIAIPGELALAVIERTLFSNAAPVPLTSAGVSAPVLAAGTARLLLDRMRTPDAAQKICLIPPELHSGNSL